MTTEAYAAGQAARTETEGQIPELLADLEALTEAALEQGFELAASTSEERRAFMYGLCGHPQPA